MKAKTKKQVEGWTFEKSGISQGFIHYFLACREQTRLVYKELWSSHYEPLFREFGSCFHWLLAQVYSGRKGSGNPRTANHLIAEYHVLWKKQNPNPTNARKNQQDLVYGLCEKVLPAYLKRWDGDFGGKYKMGCSVVKPVEWLATEEVWKLNYCVDDQLKVLIRGKYDAVFADKKKNLWLFETKCLSVISEEDIMELLPTDIQCMLYLLAIKLQFKKKPAGVLYNIVRRPGLRQGKDETLAQLLGRVEKDITTPKRQDHYFKRIEMAIDWPEVEAWQKNFLDPILQEIRDWDMGKAGHWQNPDALASKYGHCMLFDMLTKGDKSKYYKRKFVFNELQDNI